MRKYTKYCSKSFFMFAFVFGMIQFSPAIANKLEMNCKLLVGNYCSTNQETCKLYCKLKNDRDCDCNTRTGSCAVKTPKELAELGKNATELDELNTARFTKCVENPHNKSWQYATTINWLKISDRKEKLRPGELGVREAIRVCERLVKAECINVHAPKYCEVSQIDDCNVEELCFYSKNKLITAQVQAQLMACIASKRDPYARKTGALSTRV